MQRLAAERLDALGVLDPADQHLLRDDEDTIQ